MGKLRLGRKLLGALLVCGSVVPAWAAPPTPAQVLAYKPRQEGVDYSIPKPQEETACKVEGFKGQGKATGWVLRDSQGLVMRKFFDANGDNKVDIWSYYKDGGEVYREIDSDFNGKPEQYRWLNAGGTKWGVDTNEDGKIDAWKVISPEEVSQEVLASLVTHDVNRLQALMFTEQEMKTLEIPASEANRIREGRKNAAAKFQAALQKTAGLSDKTKWLHLEAQLPQTLPADQIGSSRDFVHYVNGTILCATGDKNEWIQTGEIVQAGLAWRIVDAPMVGLSEAVTINNGGPGDKFVVTDKDLQALLDQLKVVDEKAPHGGDAGPNPAIVRYNLARTDLLEKIVGKVKPEERDPWIRQIADSLSAASQSSGPNEKVAYERLTRLEDQIVKAMPGSNLAAYVTFREMTADYAIKLSKVDKNEGINKIQTDWLERLAKFVQTYPKSDDAADALLQAGMVSEFVGKEAEAKKWYEALVKNFPDRPIAHKAQGCVNRLEMEGKPMKLAAPLLTNPATAFDLEEKRGKVVAVYYWASWNGQCVGDFAKLKQLLDTYGPKGFDVVTVNLDDTPETANGYLAKNPSPGTHIYKPGGLDSPLATQYGVMGLPSLFLVGTDGKVLSRTLQLTTLEDELKKHVK